MRIAPLAVILVASLLTACAPPKLTDDQARTAMQSRMERPGARAVKVTEIHAFKLSDCADAVGQAGTVCTVEMDVAFTVDDQPQRDKASQRMRFAYGDGRWVAYPVP